MTAAVAVPRAVLYDWDNTLVDNWGTILAAINHTLVAFGREPWTVAESRLRVKQSLRDSFPRIFGDRWTDARDAFYRYFEQHHLEHLNPLPGAAELLAALHDKGVYQAVVSNKNGRYLRAEADALGWSRYFGRLVGAQDAAFDKPHGAPVLMALEPAGIPAGPDVWFVGDADIDMECAHGAGLLPVLVGEADGEGFMTFPPTHRFATCDALRALVCGGGDTISVPAIAEAVQRSPRSDRSGGGSL
ncbi:HAD family hydrolase [Azospirillum sp. RWY-5-1]|uniref:phosphoglycolate phosphatase n=1 Tax=Azospirillum oleiclasticum TaxID=2735135 RepID=A0ABX2T7M3_9PROT|nr:HAD family hydrolase [Azospirillum oleiclasticum]NYZ12048.1 HAD family hydrolase [Azospirillum oleiclasticum]NYZ19208.1 HAD family hydrolase [Azospirillum oleiclasticum]